MWTLRKRLQFTDDEIKQLEVLLMEAKDEPKDTKFYQNLTTKINLASARTGKKALQWIQVRRWILNKKKHLLTKEKPNGSISDKLGENQPKVEFEAKSANDGGWYDVARFLSHRFNDHCQFECLIRYENFGTDEDEWVIVKEAVRRRSVPIDSDECYRVAVGDHVICFHEMESNACYFDAHVMEIQRKRHDIRGCRCRFLIRYDHDSVQETVSLERICCRP
ncbi:hypothetical protein ZOSMA_5G01990 [Zostera marina]|uniref:SAWADEE domain-containing protein n=1 Tax=Zostera marina TaxID=29655 RepID=A0A0K9NWA5_ZOSMR|nr:hypothetical protein ZOSMA_5G01990 [Zostera marina]